MDYTYVTTPEMDEALQFHAEIRGIVVKDLLDKLITPILQPLIMSFKEHQSKIMFESYQKSTPIDRAAIDAILSKVEQKEAL